MPHRHDRSDDRENRDRDTGEPVTTSPGRARGRPGGAALPGLRRPGADPRHGVLARRRSEEVERTVAELHDLLRDAVLRPPMSVDDLWATPRSIPFVTDLADPPPVPRWQDYEPSAPRPGAPRRVQERHARRVAEARQRYEDDVRRHATALRARDRELAERRLEHERLMASVRAGADARNARLAALRGGADGPPPDVAWFVERVLRRSAYPRPFPRRYLVVHQEQLRRLTVTADLPGRDVVPAVAGYRTGTSGRPQPVPRAEAATDALHDRVVAATVLRILHEVFGAVPPGTVAEVEVVGTTVPALAGAPDRRRGVRVVVSREQLARLPLAEGDPVRMLAELGADLGPATGTDADQPPASSST